MLNKNIRKAKSIYHDRYFNNCFSYMKKTWIVIDSLLGRNRSNKLKKIGPFKINDELLNGNCEIKNLLNEHFC